MKKLIVLLFLALAGCASGPQKNIFPPQVRLQELAVQSNGDWVLKVRIQNFSNVPMNYERLSVELTVDDVSAGTVRLDPDSSIGPNSAEIFNATITPSSDAKTKISATSLPYRLKGEIFSVDPGRGYKLNYESALSATPGVKGTFR
jgi:FlaG/FlaF family flagellin (archaellin)